MSAACVQCGGRLPGIDSGGKYCSGDCFEAALVSECSEPTDKTSAPSASSHKGPMGDGEPPVPASWPDEGASVSSPPDRTAAPHEHTLSLIVHEEAWYECSSCGARFDDKRGREPRDGAPR